MTNSIFHSGAYHEIEQKIKQYLNDNNGFLSPVTMRSPRAVGDALQEVIAENFLQLAEGHCSNYSSDFARRAMADLAFNDSFGNYHIVDVKTHREDTKFNMPNLTSVERLARFYESDENYFSLLVVKYSIQDSVLNISDVIFRPIEFLDWECLTIGALGWGQIQIANSNNISIRDIYSRKLWMLELCDILADFYPREIAKISSRIERFEKVRAFWEAKQE